MPPDAAFSGPTSVLSGTRRCPHFSIGGNPWVLEGSGLAQISASYLLRPPSSLAMSGYELTQFVGG